jgi:hypothetical protein
MPGGEPTRTKLLFINKGRLNYIVKENGQDTWHSHGQWTGHLVNISFKWVEPKEKKPYEAINIHLNDGVEDVIITCKFNSGYGRSFAKAIGNADLSRPITITPTYKEEGEKKEGGIFIQQNGAALKWQFTRDNPNGCPPAQEFDKGDNEKIYSFTEQMTFLKDHLINNVVQSIQHPLMNQTTDIQKKAETMSATRNAPDKDDDGMDPDDLPF